MSITIKVEHISKAYRLGVINHGMLYKDIQSMIARKKGKPDPHSKIGSEYVANSSERFWALKDISFEVEQGDRLGIIGRNGAGKSTLLKILSRITAPTEGIAKIRGRVTSLLEVGTGFHPELTGRENVYLNGAILGLKKREIDKKFDEIVAFSEIEQFIDTPVKRYSSGMYVRLAFAVAAHLDSEILLADEVLAVGDAAFQKKCLGKMEDVSKNQGRTILFVSHNMSAVSSLCQKGLYLKEGMIDSICPIDKAIAAYHTVNKVTSFEDFAESKSPSLHRIWFENKHHEIIAYHTNGARLRMCIEIKADDDRDLELHIITEDEISRPVWAFTNFMYRKKPIRGPGNIRVELNIQMPKLTTKEISFDVTLRKYQSNEEYFQVDNLSLPILDSAEDVDKIKYAHWPIFCDIEYIESIVV
jgi:lipopolysaccharide transport system ATP-binding protein